MSEKRPRKVFRVRGKVLRAFLEDRSYVSGILGPVGSGKSTACVMKLWRIACEQKPSADGVRRTFFAIARKTFPELRTTTLETFREWLGEWTDFRMTAPFEGVTRARLKDGTTVEMRTLFLAIDKSSLDKIRSLNITGFWANEARELDLAEIEALRERSGRYPIGDGHPGPTWFGGVMDTNAPSEDHWWPIMSGDVEPPAWAETERLAKPEGWTFFKQPPAVHEVVGPDGTREWQVNPDAENIEHVGYEYYKRLIQGARDSYIAVQLACRYGRIETHTRVYRTWSSRRHARKAKPVPQREVIIGLDFGRTPGAVLIQRLSSGRWHVFEEAYAENVSAAVFAQRFLIPMITRWRDHPVIVYADPAGEQMTQAVETSPFLVLRSLGIPVRPAPTQDPVVRIGTVERLLNLMLDADEPALTVDPSCRLLIAGFEGGYRFKVNSEGEYGNVIKNKYSHVHDALQYALVGAGEGRALLGGSNRPPWERTGPRMSGGSKLGW